MSCCIGCYEFGDKCAFQRAIQRATMCERDNDTLHRERCVEENATNLATAVILRSTEKRDHPSRALAREFIKMAIYSVCLGACLESEVSIFDIQKTKRLPKNGYVS